MIETSLLKYLPPADLAAAGLWIEKNSQVQMLKRAEAVYRQGDPANGIYIVAEGLIGLSLIGQQSGKEHLLRLFKAGDFFGHRSLFQSESHHASAIALESSRIYVLQKKDFFYLTEKYPAILRAIVEILAKELGKAERLHVDIIENQILPRTAHALVYLKDVHPNHNWTRQEIANFCASTVSTVIKTLALLEERGLIEQEGRVIHIKDRDALLHFSEE